MIGKKSKIADGLKHAIDKEIKDDRKAEIRRRL
jgi:hypothetical protein